MEFSELQDKFDKIAYHTQSIQTAVYHMKELLQSLDMDTKTLDEINLCVGVLNAQAKHAYYVAEQKILRGE